jgi:hypothetical protein
MDGIRIYPVIGAAQKQAVWEKFRPFHYATALARGKEHGALVTPRKYRYSVNDNVLETSFELSSSVVASAISSSPAGGLQSPELLYDFDAIRRAKSGIILKPLDKATRMH